VSDEVDDGVELGIGRGEPPSADNHVDVYLRVHLRIIAKLDEASAADAMASLQPGLPRCRVHVEGLHGTSFDLDEFRIR
jgi:hypothetical protein